MSKNKFNPKDETDIFQRANKLNSDEKHLMKWYELTDPTKEHHSWWILESRDRAIPEYNKILGEKKALAKRVHKRRKKRSRTMDESFNAPVTTDYVKWRANMNRLDLMGVDTVPRSRRIERIEKFKKAAEKQKAFSKIVNTKQSSKTMRANGFFRPATKEIQLSKGVNYPQHTRTLAHELSHAIDNQFGDEHNSKLYDHIARFGITELFEKTDKKELKRALQWTRDKRATTQTWAKKPYEQTAQFLANYMIDPRSMRREFPNLSKATERFVLPRLFNKNKGGN